MCTPAVIPWVIGALGLGAVVKNQQDKALQGARNAQSEAAKAVTATAAPKVPAPPAALMSGEPLKDVDAQTAGARAEQKRKAQALAGMGGTLKTSGLGIPGPATTQSKTLLGQ